MEVVMPVSASDFNFDSTASPSYMSAPSTPKRFGADYGYFSAPSSPSRAASIYNDLARFDWDKRISPPKSAQTGNNNQEEENDDDDFAFQFGFSSQNSSLSTAEELFEKGKIRPLKPQVPAADLLSPKGAFGSPGKGFVPAEEPRRASERGRGSSRNPSTNRRGARSVSPFRAPEYGWEEPVQTETHDSQADPATSKGSTSSSSSSKRWSLKDLLLFRSASEGRATTGKDPLRKYSGLGKTRPEEPKNPSCRPGETPASGKKGRSSGLSAHERHYTTNRAVSEEMRRKTFLPYKPGLFGFNLSRRL